jgi:hypothetical protein
MVAFNTVKAGDTLWDVHSQKMGNTTMRQMGSWQVDVLEVHAVPPRVWARWNGNAPRWMYRREVEKLRRSRYKARKPSPSASAPLSSEN